MLTTVLHKDQLSVYIHRHLNSKEDSLYPNEKGLCAQMEPFFMNINRTRPKEKGFASKEGFQKKWPPKLEVHYVLIDSSF